MAVYSFQYAINLAIPIAGFKLISPIAPPLSSVPNPPSTVLTLPIHIVHSTWPGLKPRAYAPAPTYHKATNQGKQAKLALGTGPSGFRSW